MSLKLVNKKRTYPLSILDTTFNIISMSIVEKEQLSHDLTTNLLPHIEEAKLCKHLASVMESAIVSIDGYPDQTVKETLESLEEYEDLRTIARAIIEHCRLTKAEAKNSDSSSEQHIPASAGNAENLAGKDEEPASTTR